jgi:fatty acid desaturase
VAVQAKDVEADERRGLAALRRAAGRLPFYRAFVAIEFTGLALLAAILGVTKALVIVLIPVAAVTAVGHLLAILTSSRLR